MRLGAKLVREVIPKFNPVIAGGVATEHFKELEAYLNQIIKDASNHFPEGLKYHGCRRATPEEEVRFILEDKASTKGSHWTVEIAKSTVYLMIYEFEYEGEKIEHKLYLPFLVKGAQIWIRGTANTIIPVLTAPVFSVEGLKQQIFLKLLMNKLAFKRVNYPVIMDDINLNIGVAWAKIHRINPKEQAHYDTKKDESVRMYHATAMYLFCEYGLEEAFRRYCGIDIKLSINEPINYPDNNRSDFIEFRTTGRKPTSVKTKYYQPHGVTLAIPKEAKEDTMAIALVGGFFYIADNYPDYMLSIEEFNDTSFWKVLLGKMCLQTKDNIANLLSEAERHMDNVRRMLDAQQRTDLNRADINVENMIDLLAYVAGNFSQILRNEENGNLYGKRLLILRNILEDIIKGVNMLTFKAGSNKAISSKTIKQDIARFLVSDRILSVQKMPCTETIMSPSDCMAFSHTCKFLLQNNISKSKKSGVFNVNDQDKHLHASVLEIGSYQAIKDSEPTGRQLLNMYQVTSPSGITRQNPELKDKIAYLDHWLTRA